MDFYDRGGNVNPYLDEKMRDTAAEAAYVKARAEGKPVDPSVKVYGPTKKPIIPLKLNLTPQEKADLVLFLKRSTATRSTRSRRTRMPFPGSESHRVQSRKRLLSRLRLCTRTYSASTGVTNSPMRSIHPPHHVAGLQERPRRRADAGRGARRDDVAGFERHHPRDELDHRRDREDLLRRRRVLAHRTVHVQFHPQRLRVGDRVGRRDARPAGPNVSNHLPWSQSKKASRSRCLRPGLGR